MKKVIFFLKNLVFSLLVFIGYFFISIFLTLCFNKQIEGNNLLVSNIFQILVYIIPFILLSIIFFKDIKNSIKTFNRKTFKIGLKNWLIGLGLMIVSNFLLSFIIPQAPNNQSANIEFLFKYPTAAIVTMCFLAPYAEEIVFRLAPRKIFNHKATYMIYSGLIFGLMHVLTSGSLIEMLYIIPYGILGAMFAKSVYETDNIGSSIIMHSFHNTLATLLIVVGYLGGL